MSDYPNPYASQLHLLGRAASQVIVHFGRYEIEPVVQLDIVHPFGMCLRVTLPREPAPPVLTKWWALEWMRYFDRDEVSSAPPHYAFTLTVRSL